MSINLYINGYRDMDGEFKKMIEAKQFCDDRKLSYPKELEEYFGNFSKERIEIIRDEMLQIEIPRREWMSDYAVGYEIDVKDIPKECKTIRVYLS